MKMISIKGTAGLIGPWVERARAAGLREPGFFKAFLLSFGVLFGIFAGRKHMLRYTAISFAALIFSGIFLLYKSRTIDEG